MDNQIIIEMATTSAARLMRKENPGNRPNDKIEQYVSPSKEIKVYCTSQELEDFENDEQIALNDDVVNDIRDFRSLVAYMVKNYGLKVI